MTKFSDRALEAVIMDIARSQSRCRECGDPCSVVEETFDYSGTHCTNGAGGTHHTGIYVSDCCLADVVTEIGEDDG